MKGLVADFTYNGYDYKNIQLNGLYDNKKIIGEVALNDANGVVHFDGLLDFSELMPYYNFKAKVKDLYLGKMNLTTKYPDLVCSFDLDINAKGNNLDNITGDVVLNDVFIKNGDKDLNMKKFEILSDISENENAMVITSDFINGVIDGKYTLSTIIGSVQYVASQYLPALNNTKIKMLKETDNNFDFDIKINNLDTISALLNLPWQTSSDINVFGFDNLYHAYRKENENT